MMPSAVPWPSSTRLDALPTGAAERPQRSPYAGVGFAPQEHTACTVIGSTFIAVALCLMFSTVWYHYLIVPALLVAGQPRSLKYSNQSALQAEARNSADNATGVSSFEFAFPAEAWENTDNADIVNATLPQRTTLNETTDLSDTFNVTETVGTQRPSVA
ncbi:hypothetical protein V5799_021557 [Amblyomma americanum]|uniref:Transmembrane protein n=1 Tax=Amblyomma americanum TaxID=6943 RepID=A0AAQ4FN53_AMBAM